MASALVNAKRSTSNGVVKIVVVLFSTTVAVVRTVRKRGCLVSSYKRHESSLFRWLFVVSYLCGWIRLQESFSPLIFIVPVGLLKDL